ncbi:autotransporter outer membrane beta-barrel domain-containing protein [Devosia chinhatensis]|uniref:Autotransporter domain-containing protein n=1 Tax=Devosia chinhatensis TaxID=429727 RepID=A0A0F5FIJ8_9HYPH|nr:autotransporter outer membrane beta-barrel domain-containing protein [Devosia chinhatensis]KKB08613.1 hypothetical protein VE26_00495 [Devosia chinhatensis]
MSVGAAALGAAPAYAGHLFTQNTNNTPTWIQAGQGIRIDQERMESANGSGNITFDFSPNSSVPDGANTANTNWWAWSAGDVLKFTVPTTAGSLVTTIAYDADANCAYSFCGVTGSASYLSVNLAALGSAAMEKGRADVNTSNPLSWTVEALAGEFSLAGYRIYFSNGTLNGTGAAPLTQDSVVDSGNLGGGPSIPDIDTANPDGYTIDQVNNNEVNPVFNGGTLALNSGGAAIIGNFTVNATGTGTDGVVQIGQNTQVVFQGAFSGAGTLEKSGDGTMVLQGNNTNAGGFAVQQGVLNLTDSGTITGGVSVNNGSTFVGNGTVNGATTVSGTGSTLYGSGQFNGDVTINTGALHKPGNSPGDVTVNGNYTVLNGGTLEIEIASNGVSDRIFVNGLVTLGGELRLLPFGTGFIAPTYSYTVIHNDGADAIVGDFASLRNDLAFYNPVYTLTGDTGNDLVITLNRNANGFSSQALTENQLAVARALDGLSPTAGTPLALEYERLMGLLTRSQVRTALASMSGEVYATSASLVSNRALQTVVSRTSGRNSLLQCQDRQGASVDMAQCVLANTVRVDVTGAYAEYNGTATEAATLRTGGVSGEIRVPFQLGEGIAYGGLYFLHENGQVGVNSLNSSSSVATNGVGLTSGWAGNGWDVSAVLGYTNARIAGTREINIGGTATAASGTMDLNVFSGSIGVGYAIEVGDYVVRPFAALSHIQTGNSAFSETSTSPLAYSANAGSTGQTFATVGLEFSGNFDMGDFAVSPRAQLALTQRLGGSGTSLSGTVGGSAPFTTLGNDPGATMADIGVGLDIERAGLTISFDYGAQLTSTSVSHRATAGLKFKF